MTIVAALADLLSDRDRQRLDRLADPNAALAEAARAEAADSTGTGRLAWACVALVLAKTQTPEEARAALDDMVEDDRLRTLARGCLGVLLDDDTATEAP